MRWLILFFLATLGACSDDDDDNTMGDGDADADGDGDGDADADADGDGDGDGDGDAEEPGDLRWLMTGGGPFNDNCYSTASAGDGTIVATCATYGAATWGLGTADEVEVESAGEGDLLFLGLDPADGAIRWHVLIGGAGDESVYFGDEPSGFAANATLADGRVVALVQVGGPVTGPDVDLADAADGDVILFVLTADGAVDAALPIASGDAFEDQFGWASSPLRNGGLAISGGFMTSLTLLPGTADELPLAPNGDPELSTFVLFLDENLAFDRVLRVGAADESVAARVVQAEDGGLLMTGGFAPTLTLGATTPQVLEDLDGRYAAFVARLDESDEPVWAFAFGGDGEDYARTIVETSDGGVVVAGYYGKLEAHAAMSVPGLDGITLEGDRTDLPNLFVLGLDADGTPRWLEGLRSEGFADTAFTVSAIGDGDVVVSGVIGGFEPGSSDGAVFSDGEEIELSIAGTFLVRYDRDGARVWTRVVSPALGFGAEVLADGSVVQSSLFLPGAVYGYGESNEVEPPGSGDSTGAVTLHAP